MDDVVKCIYCNSSDNLTLSDIISYALTKKKLVKRFVCKEHNAFTNNEYEKEFIKRLDGFRNRLGFETRDGNAIKYDTDMTVGNVKMTGVRLSDTDTLFDAHHKTIGSVDGRKAFFGEKSELDKIPGIQHIPMTKETVTIHLYANPELFFDSIALHTMAKIAYEWHCYITGIEEYKNRYKRIVDYILKNEDNCPVDIVIHESFYRLLTQNSEYCTNSFFEYDDPDGFRYVVFSFWNIIAYRVRICASFEQLGNALTLHKYGYNNTYSNLKMHPKCEPGKFSLQTISARKAFQGDNWEYFAERLKDAQSIFLLTKYNLTLYFERFSDSFDSFKRDKCDFDSLMQHGDETTYAFLYCLEALYSHKDEFDASKSFNDNLYIALSNEDDMIRKTKDDKSAFFARFREINEQGELIDQLEEHLSWFQEVLLRSADI